MKIIKKRNNYNYDDNYSIKDILKLSKLIIEYFKDKENMNTYNLYKLISYFYDIKIEDIDYLEYVNSIKNNNQQFTKIIEIPTEQVIEDMFSEGHGRDFSWWTENYQTIIKSLSNEITLDKDEYTSEEIKELIEKNLIYPLYSYRKRTRKPKKYIKEKINYLVKYSEENINKEAEYFDYMIYKSLENIKLENLLNEIRIFITRLKLDSNIINYIYEEDFDDEEEYEEKNDDKENIENDISYSEISNELISIYNQNSNKKIKTSELEIIMDYLINLPITDDWYEEITMEQIINTFNNIDELDKQLCIEIENLVVSLNEVELCYEMAANFDWIDKEKMAEIVIKDGNPDFNYYFASEVEGANIERHKQLILNSKRSDEYIKEQAKKLKLF